MKTRDNCVFCEGQIDDKEDIVQNNETEHIAHAKCVRMQRPGDKIGTEPRQVVARLDHGRDLALTALDKLEAQKRDTAELEESRKTIKSLAVMLGWANVPPREVLERTLGAMKFRLRTLEAECLHLQEEGVTWVDDKAAGIKGVRIQTSSQGEIFSGGNLPKALEELAELRRKK